MSRDILHANCDLYIKIIWAFPQFLYAERMFDFYLFQPLPTFLCENIRH